MVARILAPVDGCDQSEAVLPYVEELSHRLGANVTLLHVYPPSLHGQQDIHAQYVTALADDLRGRLHNRDVDVRGVVLEGKPSREIVDFAAQIDIGLIAAASHSQTSSGHWTVGRTADKVIRETSKPVFLAREDPVSRARANGLMTRVLVPLDGSRASRDVLPCVESILELVWDSGAGMLCLTHVIPPTRYAAGPIIAKRVDLSRSELEELRGQASRYLEEVAVKLRCGGRHVETRVTVGDTATMILETAALLDINLIAMTTHGYTGFSRLFLGSVADRVLHNAKVPLLLVRPQRY